MCVCVAGAAEGGDRSIRDTWAGIRVEGHAAEIQGMNVIIS